jgi:hypothetical protein
VPMNGERGSCSSVMPAKAGIHVSQIYCTYIGLAWVPAFAGTTVYSLARHREHVVVRTFAPLTGDPYKSLFQLDK